MPIYRRTLLVPVTFTAADDACADSYARDLLDAACDGAEALNIAGDVEIGAAVVARPDAARAASLAALLVHAASAAAQLTHVRVEVNTVPGTSAATIATYARDLEQLAATRETWGHTASPGRALWWAQTGAQPPGAARADYLVAYGTGPLAMEKVEQWRAAGLEVDSREIRGTWVHRPVDPADTAGDEVTRGYQRDGLDTVLRDLDGGAA